ncbi:hypothetical protein BD560DRAFT_487788 [Blakeslea trispora]|nr:hypothetical protein BD560DRAFT_487788 [Blakeslea trispora]
MKRKKGKAPVRKYQEEEKIQVFFSSPPIDTSDDDFQPLLPASKKKQKKRVLPHPHSIALPVGTSTSPSHKPTSVISIKVQAKIDKSNELRKAKGQEQAKNQSSSAVCKIRGESGHTGSSSSKCKFHKASKQEKSKDFTQYI